MLAAFLSDEVDLAAMVLDYLTVRDLVNLSMTCHEGVQTWRVLIHASAQRRTQAATSVPDASLMPTNLGLQRMSYLRRVPSSAADGGGWLRALRCSEVLHSTVGPQPDHNWRTEWAGKNLERLGCKFAWALELREEGWTREHAEAFAILYTWCNRDLSCAIQTSASRFAASTWLLSEAMLAAACRCRDTAPVVYAKLRGRGGLAADDSAWEPLAAATPITRLTLQTTSIALAVHELAAAGVVWAGTPSTASESEGIVRFVSRKTARGALRSLVPVGSGRFALPPLSCVTLERVDPPGGWQWPADAGAIGHSSRKAVLSRTDERGTVCTSASEQMSSGSETAAGAPSLGRRPTSATSRCFLYTVHVEW